jgi:hypothetical protein
MFEPADLDLAQMLARAFDRAWERYYLDESGTISKEIARSSLAKHLVALAKEGEKDERALAASGFLHLISLTELPPRSTAFLAAESEAKRPPIPTEGGHLFRSKAATGSERRRPPC